MSTEKDAASGVVAHEKGPSGGSKVVINGRFLSQQMTGVQRYAKELSQRILDLREDVEIWHPPGVDALEMKSTFQIGRNSGHLWEQLDLPLALHNEGSPLLLNLTNTGPIFYKKKMMTHHDVAYLRFPESYSFSFRTWYRFVTPTTLRRSLRLITSSEFSKSEITASYGLSPENFMVIPGAPLMSIDIEISHESQTIAEEIDSRYFLTVASPSAHKNLPRLIKAFSDEQIKTQLVLVGSSGRSLISTESTADNPKNIVSLGRVTDWELVNLYKHALGFIMPSLYEGFGLPPLEAQRYHVPVLSSNAASLPEVLGESALYFDPTDTDEIVEKVKQFENDSLLQARLRIEGIKNVERYSWDYSAKTLNQEINKLQTKLSNG